MTEPETEQQTKSSLENEASNTKDELISLIYQKTCHPLKDRQQTVHVMKALMGETPIPRPPLSNVHGQGPLVLSDIPTACLKQSVVVGIDEAGRGSVLGPMIYGAAFWSTNDIDKIPKDFNDSKQLSEEKRASLFKRILETPEIGFAVRVLPASEISRNMLRPEPYNLNQMSHDSAISIITQLLEAKVSIETCFIDTVGNAEHYQRRLEREFPGIQFVVESKADAKYAPCSAGSVVAKVVRDRMMEHWQFSEPLLEAGREFGSGYPSDPVCKKWMEENQNCHVFGYSDVVRFSWGPAKKALEKSACKVTFEADVEDEDAEMAAGMKRQQEQMSAFLGKPETSRKRKRYPFFERKRLEVVSKLS